ncbi:hypothetical protein ENU1_066030 [Entamoeba nuttalli P19]|uniref:Uncharacterized protein n=1 Tax=Entamoeba nuttalli (strain P19) TaxID=1076696 RepID=K2HXY4_ENTNP|nr:hypothetical protein ENU1_066030 [Entamoeba nuttalli P19]EKE41155.1 hypothetical protein ENU1_066030 [Entamoeba nuttalli P19]|eukprot:XP_008856505.1 hypothetical protein ENU1_066030 [Entamoeba nuttalli P19]
MERKRELGKVKVEYYDTRVGVSWKSIFSWCSEQDKLIVYTSSCNNRERKHVSKNKFKDVILKND